MSTLQVSRGLIKARIADLQSELEREMENLKSAVPEEPEGDNAVIRFAKYGQSYCFAAIKVDQGPGRAALWYVTQDGSRTSRQGHAPKTWEQLLAWIGERNWDRIQVWLP